MHYVFILLLPAYADNCNGFILHILLVIFNEIVITFQTVVSIKS